MRNLLRRIGFISLGLFALLLVQPGAATRALADDEPGYDYGGYDDSWQDDECCCEEEPMPEPEPPFPDQCPPGWHCSAYNQAGQGCVVELGDCPPPANTTASVRCFLYPSGMSEAMMATDPPPFPPLQDGQGQWLVDFQSHLDPGQFFYFRLMVCNGRSRVAAVHVVTPGPGDLVPKTQYFMECAVAPDVSIGQGSAGLVWAKPIDPLCTDEPFVYEE